jgi:hypothetical protein
VALAVAVVSAAVVILVVMEAGATGASRERCVSFWWKTTRISSAC